MMSSITYSLVTLTINGVTSFLQLMDVENVRFNTHFSPNKSYMKFKHSVKDGGNVINSEVFIHMLIFFVLELK